MRKFISSLTICSMLLVVLGVHVLPVGAADSPPQIFTYQGRLLDSNGTPVSSSSASMKFFIYSASSSGTCLWSNSSSDCDTDTPGSTTARTVTLTDGLFTENLGDTAAGAPYASIPTTVFGDDGSVYLEVEIDGETLSPRKQLTAAPYALNSQTLDGLDSTAFLSASGDTGTGDYIFADGSTIALTDTAATQEVFDLTATAAGNDAVELNFTLGNDGDADTVSALDIQVTSADTSDADLLQGIYIGNLSSADATVSETALQLGTGWDVDLSFADTTAIIEVPDSGTLTWQDASSNALMTLTDAGGGSPGDLTITGDFNADDISCEDCLNFSDFGDAMTLDASTSIILDGSENLFFSNGGTGSFIFDLTSTGDFMVMDNLSTIFSVADDGDVRFVGQETSGLAVEFDVNTVTTGRGVEVSADGLTSGMGLRVISESAVATTANPFYAVESGTVTSTITRSGAVGVVERATTMNSALDTLTVTGPVLTVSSDLTNTSGTIVNSGIILDVQQVDEGSTGHALQVATYGSGNGLFVYNQDSSVDTQAYLMGGRWLADGDADAGFLQFEDNDGDDQFVIDAGGATTITGIAGSNALGITAGDIVMSDGSFTLTDADNANAISATADSVTTGTAFDYSVDGLTTGIGRRLISTSANYSSATLDQTQLYGTHTGGGTMSGGVVDIDRSVTQNDSDGGTITNLTMTGPVVSIGDNCTAVGNDNCITSGNVLGITQNNANASGEVVDIVTAGTGDAIVIDHNGNGVGLDLDFAATTANGIELTMEAQTTGNALAIVSPSTRTSGNALYISDSATGDASDGTAVIEATTITDVNALGISVDAQTTGSGLFVYGGGSDYSVGAGLGLFYSDTAQTTSNSALFTVLGGAVNTGGWIGRFDGNTSTTSDGILQLNGSALTSGQVLQVNAGALTTGHGLRISTASSAFTTGAGLNINGSGVYATDGEAGLLDVTASGVSTDGYIANVDATNATTIDAVFNIEANALTSGNTLLVNAGDSPFSAGGAALAVEGSAAYSLDDTPSLLDIEASGVPTDGHIAQIAADSAATIDSVLHVSADALTTGNALLVDAGSSVFTTGTALQVSGSGAYGTDGDPALLFVEASGVATDGHIASVIANNSTTIDSILNVEGSSLTTGIGLNIGVGNDLTDGSGAALRIDANETTSSVNLVEIISDVGSSDDTKFVIEADGSVYADGNFVIANNTTDTYNFTDVEGTDAEANVHVKHTDSGTLAASRSDYGGIFHIDSTVDRDGNTYNINGLSGVAENSGTETSSLMSGVLGISLVDGAVTQGFAVGIDGAVYSTGASTTISTAYGVRGDIAEIAGNITTGVGGFFDSSGGDTRIGIHTNAGGGTTNITAFLTEAVVRIDDDTDWTDETASYATGGGDLYVVDDIELGGTIYGFGSNQYVNFNENAELGHATLGGPILGWDTYTQSGDTHLLRIDVGSDFTPEYSDGNDLYGIHMLERALSNLAGSTTVSQTGIRIDGSSASHATGNSANLNWQGLDIDFIATANESSGSLRFDGIRMTNPTTISAGDPDIYGVTFETDGAAGDWDAEINFEDTDPSVQIANTGVLTFADDAGNTLATITDSGATGTFTTDAFACTSGDCIDFTELSDSMTIDAATTITGAAGNDLNILRTATAGTGEDGLGITLTTDAADGSDAYAGLAIDITNGDHTGSSNTVYALDIGNITADAQAEENAINIGTGWDADIAFDNSSAVVQLAALGEVSFQDLGGTTSFVITDVNGTDQHEIVTDSDTPLAITGAGDTVIDITTDTNERLLIMPAGTGDTVFATDADTNVQVVAQAAPTDNIFTITNNGFATATAGADAIEIEYDLNGVSASIMSMVPDDITLTGDIFRWINLNSPTGTVTSTGSDEMIGIDIQDPQEDTDVNIDSKAISINGGWDTGINIEPGLDSGISSASTVDFNADVNIGDAFSDSLTVAATAEFTAPVDFNFATLSDDFNVVASGIGNGAYTAATISSASGDDAANDQYTLKLTNETNPGDYTTGGDAFLALESNDTNDPMVAGILFLDGATTGSDIGIGIDFGAAIYSTAEIKLGNEETIDNTTDDIILFQGDGGANDTDIAFDLDGTSPTIYSVTDSEVTIDDNLSLTPGTAGDAINATLPAGSQGLVVDASTTTNTSTDGIVDIDLATATSQSKGISIDVTTDDDGSNDTVFGLHATFDVNETTGNDLVYGLYLETEDNGVTDSDMMVDTMLLINNADSDDTLTNGISILTAGGAISTGINVSGGAIGDAIDIGANSIAGTNFSVDTAGVITANFNTSGTAALCWDNSGSSEISDCSGSPVADYAEMYPVAEGITYGDIVVPGSTEVTTQAGDTIAQLVKSSETYQGPVAGIVSDNYGDFTSAGYNIDEEDNPMPVALVGRVPVNVTNENGSIAVGDYLTTSSTPGKAMKATQVGRVIGMALGAFDGVSGQVMVQVNNSWSMGEIISDDGTATTISDDIAVAAKGEATAATNFDSYGLELRGSAWNGAEAEAVAMVMSNQVTDTDDYRLSFENTQGTEVAYITNEGTLSVAGDVVIAGKLYPSDRGTAQTDKYIYYDGDAGPGGDFMRTNAKGWATGSYDFAEMFPSTEELEPGDVVAFAGDGEFVKRTIEDYEAGMAGIVSTRPGFLAGHNEEGSHPIALAGRVPTKVTLENGEIEVGDPLTSSSTPGKAMKATEAGIVIGYALESFNGGSDDRILTFVNVGYWGGEPTEAAPGTNNTASGFATTGTTQYANLNMTGNIYMNGHEIWSVGRVRGMADAWEITADGTIKTETLLKNVIDSYQGDKVETIAVTSPEAIITLSGTATTSGGTAEVRFENVAPEYNDVISAIAPVRVVVTPSGPVSLYVSEKDNNHFTVQRFAGSADVEFDWMVTAYRKGYEPDEDEEIVDGGDVEAPEETEEEEPATEETTEEPADETQDEPAQEEEPAAEEQTTNETTEESSEQPAEEATEDPEIVETTEEPAVEEEPASPESPDTTPSDSTTEDDGGATAEEPSES